MQLGGWEWVSPAGPPPLQWDSLPAGLQLGFGVSIPRREVTATCEFTPRDCCRLRPADWEQRERVWSLLRGLLETYSHLREEDQSFAVEVPMLWASLTFGVFQGWETAWSLRIGEKAMGWDFRAAPWEQWKPSSDPRTARLGLSELSSFLSSCTPGCGAADPSSAV